MSIGRGPACFECRHLDPPGDELPTCAAFPSGIPREIYFDGFDHRRPFPGDRGIRWEPADGVPEYPPALTVVSTRGSRG